MAEKKSRMSLGRAQVLYVYLPIALCVVLAIAILSLLAWGVLAPGVEEGSTSILGNGGMADLVITAVCLAPMAVLGLVLPAGGIYLLYKRQERGGFVRKHVVKGMRKGDELVGVAQVKTEQASEKVGEGVVQARGRMAYFNAIVKHVTDRILGLFE